MRNENNYLFSKYDLGGTIRNTEQKMFDEIDNIESGRLLNTNIEEWISYFEQEYSIDSLKLKEEEISTDQNEKQIDVRYDRDRFIRDRNQPVYVAGTEIKFYVPYEGDQGLFYVQPSTRSFNPPTADVSDGELIISFSKTNLDPEVIKNEFNQTLTSIKQHIDWQKKEIDEFNNSIANKAKTKIENRKAKLVANQDVVSSLGFPLRQRSGTQKTYAVSSVKKKIVTRPKQSTEVPFKSEPTLEIKQYEEILSIISNMAIVLERSPKSFSGMGEEDIRQHFLVQLNGQYEGQATGETFNAEGKTDILVRSEGKNIFIAECKFWKGPKYFTDAIDQLLKYTSWRDTKTALLMFNRGKSLSSILTKIPELVQGHANYVSQENYSSESGFRYMLHHKNDKDRNILLTILVFEIPS